ncbi:hypothetical protein ES708_08315 [subsurface metagenome]
MVDMIRAMRHRMIPKRACIEYYDVCLDILFTFFSKKKPLYNTEAFFYKKVG